MQKVKVSGVVSYGGHTIKQNGIVELTLKADYSDLPMTINLFQLLNEDMHVEVRVPNEKPKKIGIMRINRINVSSDGCSTVKLVGDKDYIELDNINTLPTVQDDEPGFRVRFLTHIDDSEFEVDEEGE
jgi:hypothetical protein